MSVLETKGISKYFPGVRALSGVSISFEPGKVHCIVGENGAGKSTLIKCLTGIQPADEGTILIDGEDARENPALFRRVAYVPQEIDLFENMSVAENLFMPFDRYGYKGFVNRRQLNERARGILEEFHLPVSPDDKVQDITVSQRQLLQIARAVSNEGCEALILDEPTTSLTSADTDYLFQIIRKIRAEQKAVVFISHKFEEIFALGDDLTILRNGEKVGEASVKDVDEAYLIACMTGKEQSYQTDYFSENVTGTTLLSVKELSGEHFGNVSFDLKAGEVLGFYGLVGAGRSELMQAIFGYRPIVAGEVVCGGENWKAGDTTYAVGQGLIYLPEERRQQGIFPMLSVRDNITMTTLSKLKSGFGISGRMADELAAKTVGEYAIKTPDLGKEIRFLSGGNQQKAIIGRSMNCKPKVLIFDEPTKGIDVGTKDAIYKLMKRIAEEQEIGIILISSEMEEILKCSNRIITMYEGHVMNEYPRPFDREGIMKSILGIRSQQEKAG